MIDCNYPGRRSEHALMKAHHEYGVTEVLHLKGV